MSKQIKIILISVILIILICLLIIYILKKTRKESFSMPEIYNSPNNNLIRYGCFENQHHISNSQVGSGNDIINYPNPGDSSYVLRQSTQLSNVDDNDVSYKIKLNLNNKKIYKLSCWVCLTDDWDGSNYIFDLKIYNLDSYIIKRSQGNQIDSKKMYNIMWTQFEYILEFNNHDTGEISWFLGGKANNNNGFRYFTGVSIVIFNPLLSNFKLTYGLQLFTNSYQDISYNSSNLIWKDLSNSGRDFEWSQMTSIQNDGGVNIKNISIKGPACADLGIQTNQNFTIMWLAKYTKLSVCTPKQTIFEIFSLYTESKKYPYIRVSIDLYYQQFIITIGHITYPGISLGLCHSQSLYTLIKNGNRFFIRKDDIQLNSTELFIYSESEKSSFSEQKCITINPNKDLNADIYAMLIYNYSLNCYEIETVRSYLFSIKKINKYIIDTNCCASKKKIEMCDSEYNFDVDDEQMSHFENTSVPYESTAYQMDYYNSSLRIPLRKEFKSQSKDTPKRKESYLLNQRKQDTIKKSQKEIHPENNLEHFVSSRSKKNNSDSDSMNNNKFTNFRKMLIDQQYIEEENPIDMNNQIPEEEVPKLIQAKELGSIDKYSSEEEVPKLIPAKELGSIDQYSSEEEVPKLIQAKELGSIDKYTSEEVLSEKDYKIGIPKDITKTESMSGEEDFLKDLINFEKKQKQQKPTSVSSISSGREFPETPQEEFISKEKDSSKLLAPQVLDKITSSETYQDPSTKSKKRQLVIETEEDLKNTAEEDKRESLKLKIKLLRSMISEEEDRMIRDPLTKPRKLIDTQGQTIEDANYEISTQDACFNRVPINNDTKCDVDMSDYIKKSDIENTYISKSEVNKEYIRKDSIPCWGCNLK